MADEHYPDELRYHAEHGWARIQDDHATFGISWFAQDSLLEIVAFNPPQLGGMATKDQPYADVESLKAAADLCAPLSGEIVQVNDALEREPKTINDDPYGQGWLVKVKLSDPSEADSLLSAENYQATVAP